MTSRYVDRFAQLKEKNEGAFVPFVTMGDPNKQTSFEIIKTLIDAGADALELGIPFSDPIADGPTIQAAAIRALDNGMTPSDCFEVLKQIREYNADIPIGLLLYSNLVVANGIDSFYQHCADAGVDSVLVADVPIRESKMFREAASKHGIDPIFIATPNAKDEVLAKLADYCSGYTYLLSRAGVTGAETAAEMPAEDLVKRLNQFNAPPALLGFGISKPQQVKEAIQAGADGAISGSAVVNIIAENLGNKEAMLTQLANFVSEMKAATKR